jgi:adenylate kinase family enzyme
MNKNFVSEMNFDLIKKYDNPFVITFCGLPGCGKTDIARSLSKELKIYLLSNDYVRNYYYQLTKDYSEDKRIEIDNLVSNINKERLNKIIENNISFIYDKCFNKQEDYDNLYNKIGDKYKIIKIKIKSDDINNITTILNRNMNYEKKYDGVIGDNVEYLSSFDEKTYYEIKNRIPVMLEDSYFDLIIDNGEYSINNILNLILSILDDKSLNKF